MRRLVILVLAVGCVIAACDSGGDSKPSDETTTTDEGSPADSRIDDLYKDCEDGDDDACDDLYTESEAGSAEEAFGNNCGGRGLPPGEIWCGPERQAQDSSASEPEPTPTTPQPTTPSPADQPNEEGELRDGFVNICVDTGSATRSECECAFEYMAVNYGIQIFGPDGSAPQVEAVEALTACS